jgi:hypothetical protein
MYKLFVGAILEDMHEVIYHRNMVLLIFKKCMHTADLRILGVRENHKTVQDEFSTAPRVVAEKLKGPASLPAQFDRLTQLAN